jgi:hypothetical protein
LVIDIPTGRSNSAYQRNRRRRLQAKRFLVLGDRFVQTALFLKRPTQIVVGSGKARQKADGRVKSKNGFVQPALVHHGNAEAVVGVVGFREISLRRKGLPVLGDCLVQLAFVLQRVEFSGTRRRAQVSSPSVVPNNRGKGARIPVRFRAVLRS